MLIAVGLVFFLAFSSLFALVVTRVPVVRTPVEVLDAIVELNPLKPDRMVVDAGCADARAFRKAPPGLWADRAFNGHER